MKKYKLNLKGAILAAIGAVLMIIGYGRGEVAVIISKAIRVCLECIGIG